MNIRLTLCFDGTAYCGFQVQNNGVSVCETVQNALEAVLGARPPVKGCSRTDAGVHALAFCLNFHADCAVPLKKLPLALNAHLPRDVRVLAADPVPEDFHARYAAHSKTYCYRIWNSPIDRPFDEPYSHRVNAPLDEAAMQAAAARLVGTHDFLAFCAAGSDVAARGDTVRTVTDCRVRREGALVTVTVTADGYLYNMVRILAGTLVQAGLHRIPPEAVDAILAGRDRKAAGPTLPAKGLFLQAVDYGD